MDGSGWAEKWNISITCDFSFSRQRSSTISQDCFSFYSKPKCTVSLKSHAIQPPDLFRQGLSYLFVCALEHRVWFLSEYVPPGWEPADNWCLYLVYSMYAGFCHWLFVAFSSTVRRGRQVLKLHISVNVERWCRVIFSTPVQKHTNTHTIPINLSDNLCWALLERGKKTDEKINRPVATLK